MIESTTRPGQRTTDETVRMACALAKAARQRIAGTSSRHSPHLRAGIARKTSLPSHRSIFGIALQVVRWWFNAADARNLERVVSPDHLPMAKSFAAELDALEAAVAHKKS